MGSFRTTLALSVVLVHIVGVSWLVGGRIAVQMFYCVSGFLITYVLTRGHSYKTKRSFYINRALRIYPVYFAVAAIALLAKFPSGTSFNSVFSSVPLSAKLVLGLTNLTVFGQDWVMFLAIHCGKLHFSTDFRNSEVPLYLGLLVGQAWTLGVELSFYALAPFIVTRISRIWIALMISIAVRVVLLCVGLGLKDPWTYRFFPAEMMWFMLGALSMRLLLPICEEFLDKNPRWTVFAVVLVLALLVLYPALPCSGAVKSTGLLCLIVVLLPAMFVFQNQSAFDKQIGELSYPMYICHMLVCDLSAAALAKFSVHQIAVVVSVQLGTVIAVAYGINRFIAEPVEKLRKHLRRPALN